MDAPTDRPLAAVTGASSGIGLELAKQFAENGFDLVLLPDSAKAALHRRMAEPQESEER